MNVAKKMAVALQYELSIDDGIVVDQSEKGQPLWYLHGAGNLIPGLEKELDGMAVGDKKSVVVPPEEGYGVFDQALIQLVPKEQFPQGTTFELGDRIVAQSPDGRELEARIKLIDGKGITVDFNHELAGKTLTFAVEVEEVRKASKEELDHGHVHGPGAHNH